MRTKLGYIDGKWQTISGIHGSYGIVQIMVSPCSVDHLCNGYPNNSSEMCLQDVLGRPSTAESWKLSSSQLVALQLILSVYMNVEDTSTHNYIYIYLEIKNNNLTIVTDNTNNTIL